MCIYDVEHPLHIFLDCKFAKDYWNYSGLEFDATTTESLAEWLLGKFAQEDHDIYVLIATGLWGIWYARNQKVWE